MSQRPSNTVYDTLNERSNISRPTVFETMIPVSELAARKRESQSFSGLSAANIAKTFKNWLFKKTDGPEVRKHKISLDGANNLQKQWQQGMQHVTKEMMNDATASIPKGANQQAILATLNQMSITKHQKAGMFQAHTIGSTNAKQILKQTPIHPPVAKPSPASSTAAADNASVKMGKFTVENILTNPHKTDLEPDSIAITPQRKPKTKRPDDEASSRSEASIIKNSKKKKKKVPKKDVANDNSVSKCNDIPKVVLTKFDPKTKPRTQNFAFSMNMTSSIDPDDIVLEIIRVLRVNTFHYEFLEKYLLQCWLDDSQHKGFGDKVQWEMEVCRIPVLFTNGVRMKRIFGSTFAYKKVASIISRSVRL